ncbi:MAG: serine/threonine-protein kinase, partial [Myxococcota bacterium]
MAAGLSPGDRVGPYVALFALGKGGMGEVWASLPFGASPDSVPFGASPDSVPFGASPDSVREPIALKILHRDRAGTDDALMFHDEARAAMALRHPAIVPTYEIGEDQGRHYIAMALVRGPSLSALLQRVVVAGDRLDPALIAHLGISVGRALEHAWGQASLRGQPLRLIHRDVSPHNILLDQKGRVRLTDFGVARTSIQEHQSRVGTVRGKPSYMAPEQVSGGTLDNRTDVFALGIVLYECAALRRLFGRKSALKSMDAVLRHPPPPLREAAPDLPRGLAETIERALRKRPSERFQSAAEMVHALQAAVRDLQGQPEQSLRRKIGRHFEAGAFDAESRIEAALSVARAQAEAEALEAPTRVWPVALGADPLAPEALDEVRTVYRPASAVMPEPRVLRPREPSAFSGLPPGPSFEGRPESRPSVDTRPSFSWASAVGTGALRGVTLTGTQVPGRATALLWLAAAMVVGVALTAAAARWVHREPVPAPTRTV